MFSTSDVHINSIAVSDVSAILVGSVIICFKSNILRKFSTSFFKTFLSAKTSVLKSSSI